VIPWLSPRSSSSTTTRSVPRRRQAEALHLAYESGVVCTDEVLLRPDPYAFQDAWCHARIAQTERRLCEIDDAYPAVLVNHFPLIREPTDVLHYPLFALWCGTERTADWCRRFRAKVAVYGHLHILRTTWRDGVRFEEVSVGYPREWMRPRSSPRRAAPGPAGTRCGMIEAILPPAVVAVEARDDSVDHPPFPAEEALLARASPKRRREFTTGRHCAHRAVERLCAPPGAILSGDDRHERTPAGPAASDRAPLRQRRPRWVLRSVAGDA
jgi:4'-phosphopantetheinyl transferase N-terminal domain